MCYICAVFVEKKKSFVITFPYFGNIYRIDCCDMYFCMYCTVSNSIKHLKINSLPTVILLFCSIRAVDLHERTCNNKNKMLKNPNSVSSLLYATSKYMFLKHLLFSQFTVLTAILLYQYDCQGHCPPPLPASRSKFLIRPFVLSLE